MREITPDPGGHRFLLKALAEAGHELAEELYGCPRRSLDVRGDDGWSLRLIAAHVRAHEEAIGEYVERILSGRHPRLDVIDTEAVLDDPDGCREDADRNVLLFTRLRRRLQYLLWDVSDRDWQRTGEHPYRGAVAVVQLLRELHLHDLEYLWRARRLKERATTRRRG